MNKMKDAFQEGYKKGWDNCRKEICSQYSINEEEVFAWESSDKDLDHDNHEKKGCGKRKTPLSWRCGETEFGKLMLCKECSH